MWPLRVGKIFSLLTRYVSSGGKAFRPLSFLLFRCNTNRIRFERFYSLLFIYCDPLDFIEYRSNSLCRFLSGDTEHVRVFGRGKIYISTLKLSYLGAFALRKSRIPEFYRGNIFCTVSQTSELNFLPASLEYHPLKLYITYS